MLLFTLHSEKKRFDHFSMKLIQVSLSRVYQLTTIFKMYKGLKMAVFNVSARIQCRIFFYVFQTCHLIKNYCQFSVFKQTHFGWLRCLAHTYTATFKHDNQTYFPDVLVWKEIASDIASTSAKISYWLIITLTTYILIIDNFSVRATLVFAFDWVRSYPYLQHHMF